MTPQAFCDTLHGKNGTGVEFMNNTETLRNLLSRVGIAKGDDYFCSPGQGKGNSLAFSTLQITFIKKAQTDFSQNTS